VWTFYYYAGSSRVAERINTNGTTALYFLFSDHLGSASVVVDSSGAEVSRQLYRAFGAPRYSSGTDLTDYGYTGQRADDSIGLMYYNARWYDPALARFTQADTVVPEQGNPSALDRYAYVVNNPLRWIDSSGHCWGFASGLRNVPGYDVTCENLDMALAIVQNPNSSVGDNILAGGYILVEATAHVALVTGAGLLGCSAIVGCAKAVEAALGIGAYACADGDCTNEINATARIGQNIWGLDPLKRGWLIENIFGRTEGMAPNFPTIDRFFNGIITSIKSINLNAVTYQNLTTLSRTVTGYVNSVINFAGRSWGNFNVATSDIIGRELILAIPPGASQAQLQLLQNIQSWASGQGVNIILQVVK
jgi:RHS repeat-associated protein